MKGGRSAFSRPSEKMPLDGEREGPLCGGVCAVRAGGAVNKRWGVCADQRGVCVLGMVSIH